MADPIKPTEESGQPDPITNLKAEMSRKIGNLEEQNQKLTQTLQSLVGEMQQARKPAPKPEPQGKSASELLYDDPEGFVENVVTKAVTKSSEVISKRNQEETKKQAVLTSLYNDYPEIGDSNNALTKKALENYSQLSEEERSSPMAYKVAVRDAAAELGIMPKSKRQNADDFSFGGNSGGGKDSDSQSRTRAEKETEDAVVAAASYFESAFKELGQDVNDPKFKKRLLKTSKRNFMQYE
jgi:hypothetical protein